MKGTPGRGVASGNESLLHLLVGRPRLLPVLDDFLDPPVCFASNMIVNEAVPFAPGGGLVDENHLAREPLRVVLQWRAGGR